MFRLFTKCRLKRCKRGHTKKEQKRRRKKKRAQTALHAGR
jgi:hypothetical protein